MTVHEAPLNYAGWSGSGYIITDDLGTGAYKILGGSNGGELDFSNATGPIGALIAVVGYFAGAATVVDDIAKQPLTNFLGPLGRVIDGLGFIVSIVDQSDTENFSPSDMRDLILLNTLFTIIMLSLAELLAPVALGGAILTLTKDGITVIKGGLKAEFSSYGFIFADADLNDYEMKAKGLFSGKL